jgi:hypothetical protein
MDRSVKAPGQGGDLSDWKELIAVGMACGLAAGTHVSMQLGQDLYGGPHQAVPWNPIALTLGLATHHVVWSGAATGGAITLVGGTAAGLVGARFAWRAACAKCKQLSGQRRFRKVQREAIDRQARYMARGKELTDLGRKSVAAKAVRLGVPQSDPEAAPGVLVGVSVADGQEIYGSYEDLHLDIWGPRQGKSTSRVIPALMDAVGPVVSTSNKRDVVDATRAVRERKTGGRSWVFDPQGVASEPVSWFWDPIAWVWGTDGDGAQERAAELAGHFAAAGESDRRDEFFFPEGEDLVAALFLACAVDKRPITDAFMWVTSWDEKAPIEILRGAGFEMEAGALSDQYYAPEKQRGGIFSTAKQMISCLKYEAVRPWVTPPRQGERPREAFDAAAFVTSKDTLYPLSKEGKAAAGALVTAMCAAVAAAAEQEGTRNGGRLRVPLLMLLDEAANIVRWKDLPKQYSHFGSRGIVVMTVLQSWAQGVRCWGREGMEALWSAANIKVLGSGLDDDSFLRGRSEMVGQHYELTTSVSRGRGGEKSSNTSRVTETTLTASDLGAMPRGRAVVFTAGHRATLVRTVPWMERGYHQQITDAIAQVQQSLTSATPAERRLRVVPVDTEQEQKSA